MFPIWNYTQSCFKWDKLPIYFENGKNSEFYKILWHNKDAFKGKKWLIDFVSRNPEIKIFINAGDSELIFREVEWWFLVWIEAFYEFQYNIEGSDFQKVEAFLKQKSSLHNSTSTREEKDNFIIQHWTEENITKIVRNLPPERQTALLQSLQTEFWKWWGFNLKSDAEWVFLQIGDIDNREIVIEQLKKLEQNNFENIENALSISKIDKILDVWENNKENDDESFWQSLFENEEYTWVFQQLFPYPILFLQWETLVGWKNTRWRNGHWWVATDFLFQNLSNWSFALVEIKTPKAQLIKIWTTYRWDKDSWDTNEIYSPEFELTWWIVQLQNQIETGINKFLTQLWEDFSEEKLNHIHPHWILLIGTVSTLAWKQKDSFHLFRKTMKDITIVTFDELFEKIKALKQIYE